VRCKIFHRWSGLITARNRCGAVPAAMRRSDRPLEAWTIFALALRKPSQQEFFFALCG
jgi:hypothetical protein